MPFARPIIKTPDEIERIDKAAQIAREALAITETLAAPGMRASAINQRAHEFILDSGATPANLEIEGYGYAISLSKEGEIAHGKPLQTKILKQGDAVAIDLGVKYEGAYADMARTFVIGEASENVHDLVMTCHKALLTGIAAVREGAPLSNYGRAVERSVKTYAIAKTLAGHGVGRAYHEPPKVLNFYHPDNDIPLETGMVFAFELMLMPLRARVETGAIHDPTALINADGNVSAHFEYTAVIEPERTRILGQP